jgi:CheY-like chemotaxis protein
VIPDRPVLIVEDTGPCATTLEIALGRIRGLAVHVVADVLQARDWLVSNRSVALIVTDLNLPHGSGFELIEWLKKDPLYRHVPVVVVSGDSRKDAAECSLRLGADAFFTKPFSPAEIRRKIEELLHVN